MALYAQVIKGRVWSIHDYKEKPSEWHDTGIFVAVKDKIVDIVVDNKPATRVVQEGDMYDYVNAKFLEPPALNRIDVESLTDNDFRKLVLKKLGYAVKK